METDLPTGIWRGEPDGEAQKGAEPHVREVRSNIQRKVRYHCLRGLGKGVYVGHPKRARSAKEKEERKRAADAVQIANGTLRTASAKVEEELGGAGHNEGHALHDSQIKNEPQGPEEKKDESAAKKASNEDPQGDLKWGSRGGRSKDRKPELHKRKKELGAETKVGSAADKKQSRRS
jgi:hypothetical protein